MEIQDHRVAAMSGRFGADVAMSFAADEDPESYLLDRDSDDDRGGAVDHDLAGSVPISRPGQPEPRVWQAPVDAPRDVQEDRVVAASAEPTPGGWLSPTPSPAPARRDTWAVAGLPPIPDVTGQPWQEDAVVADYMNEIGEPADDVWHGEGWVEKETGAIAWNDPIPLEPDRTPPPPKRRRSGWLGGIRQRGGERADSEQPYAAPLAADGEAAQADYGARPDSGYWGAPPETLFDDDDRTTVVQMSAGATIAPDRPARAIERVDPWLDPEATPPVTGSWRDPDFVQEPKVDPNTGMARVCETCRSFRPQQNGRGVCAHPYAFSHTRVVTAKRLACSSSMGSWWSPSDRVWQAIADIDRHSNPTPLLDEFLAESGTLETDNPPHTS